MPIRLFVADDHPILLDGLLNVFRTKPEYEVVGTAASGDAALAAIRTLGPDIAILDIRMPGLSGLEVATEILEQHLPTRVILLTADLRDNDAIEAMRIGAHGVILKQMATALLLKCIEKVHAGGRWVEQDSMRRAVEHLLRRETAVTASHGPSLTTAEMRVVELLVRGSRNKEIAERLTVSESTVKNHLHSIYVKLNVGSRRELAAWYERQHS
jgi:DNA-binding NarL/FixJ family response regulator